MKVGILLPIGDVLAPDVPQSYAEIRDFALHAEDAGLDTVWVSDHLLGDSTEDAAASPWECWSILSALAEATSRVRIGTMVLATSFRHAGVVARMADTVQELSSDRLVLGVGCGWHESEYTAFGLPFAGRVDGFEEAMQVLTGMLRDGRATVDGTHHSVRDAPVRERAHRTPPEILVAAKGPRMLALTARYADAWNLAWFGYPSARFRDTSAALDAACTAVGRNPTSLRRTVGVIVHADPPDSQAQADGARSVGGDAVQVADGLRAWQDEAVDEVVVVLEPSTPAMLATLGEAAALLRG